MADPLQITGLSNPWRAGRNSSGARLSIMSGGNNGADVLKRALAKVKPDEGGEAHFRFGKASRFTLTSPEQKTQPGVNVSWPDDGNQDDEPKDIHIIEYDEVSRCWETIRVENPDDPEQYVMVRNTTRVVFVGREDGLYRAFNLAKAGDYK
ncbi:MAG: hypothetical protein E5V66_14120 [Mesorhizobium sp.]|uniref:hypothetical protein n=1 Tax=Mesorhizobium sp. TaxID=1871066 RepID=UPI001200E880|nr:hypothetical protein [Mesorhizobium sp.]TIW11296.1 MAG: hypothetical protein E5V66_14120 [Mesorhizobium sp.]